MKRKFNKTGFLCVTVLFFLFSHVYLSSGISDDLEWKVKVGDKKNYEFSKVYEFNLTDSTTKSVGYMMGQALNGSGIIVTYSSGTTFTVEISHFEDQRAVPQITMEGVVFIPHPRHGSYVSRTTDNRTYWEAQVGEYTSGSLSLNISMDGDEFIRRESNLIPYYNQSLFTTRKTNWKTGWLTYSYVAIYQNVSGDRVLRYELELKASSNGSVPGFSVFSVLICLPVIFLIPRMGREKDS